MTATVRLDDRLEEILETLAKKLHKRKSDVIREAIDFYAKSLEEDQNRRIYDAVQKVKNADAAVYKEFEETIDDALQG